MTEKNKSSKTLALPLIFVSLVVVFVGVMLAYNLLHNSENEKPEVSTEVVASASPDEGDKNVSPTSAVGEVTPAPSVEFLEVCDIVVQEPVIMVNGTPGDLGYLTTMLERCNEDTKISLINFTQEESLYKQVEQYLINNNITFNK